MNDHHPISVAIIDDVRVVREAIIEKLQKKEGIKVWRDCPGGEEFLQACRMSDSLPDVALVDLEMRGMNGIQTIAKAKELHPSIKFIVLTIFDDENLIFDSIRSGASGFILKDDDALNLIAAIRQVHDHDATPMSPNIARKILTTLGADLLVTGKPYRDFETLTKRENEILELTVQGLDHKKVAAKLFISPATVRTHIAKIYEKLQVHNRTEAVNLVNRHRK